MPSFAQAENKKNRSDSVVSDSFLEIHTEKIVPPSTQAVTGFFEASGTSDVPVDQPIVKGRGYQTSWADSCRSDDFLGHGD